MLAKLAERGEIGAGERVVVFITGEGLKTLDAAREAFQMHEIEPDARAASSAEFDAELSADKIPPMAVTVKIPAQLRAATGGEDEVEVDGATVGEALDAVFAAHGDLRERITQDGDAAPVRQRLRLRRGHPLPGGPRDRSSPTATR